MKTTGSLGAAILAALMSSVLLAAGAPAQPPSIELLFKNEGMRGAKLSPDGTHVAILTQGQGGRQVLAVADTTTPADWKVIAGSTDFDVDDVYWINDKRLYIEIVDKKSDAPWVAPSSYAVNVDGSKVTTLIVANWEFVKSGLTSGVSQKTLGPEYALVSMVSDGSDDVIVERHTYNNVDNISENTRLYRFNTVTRALTDLVGGSQPELVKDWVLDAYDRPRLAVSSGKGRRIIRSRDPQTKEWVELANFDALNGNGWYPVFFDFDDNLYVRASDKGGTAALFKYDIKNRQLASEPTIRAEGFDFSGYPKMDEAAHKMIGIAYRTDAHGTVWLDKGFVALQKSLDDALPGAVNTISCGNCLSSPYLLVKSTSDQQPSVYYLYNVQAKRLAKLGEARPGIQPEQMGMREFVHYPARDGLSIPAYITTPPGDGKGPYPAVVLVHGGPYTRGSSWEWEQEAQFLATRGYLVIQPEFRGSTGFGFPHFKAGWKQWGLAMQDDLADAAKWAIAKGLADPKRIGIAGGSYGGYATLMGLLKNPELFRCGYVFAGVSDINLMFSTDKSQMSDVSLDSINYGMKTLIGDPATDAAQFMANSPLAQAARIHQPILMGHGDKDMRVALTHGLSFRDAISKTNKQFEWVSYVDEGHGLVYEKNRFDFYRRVEAFLDKNLKSPG